MFAPSTSLAARLSEAFSTAVFRELAREHPDNATHKRIQIIAEYGSADGASLGEAFNRALRLLVREYRNEYVFKNELVSKIIFGKHSPRTASALLELRMGRSWADLVILNGTSTTYEIKTDLDQFARLATQLSDYTSRSEYVNVVTSDKRAATAERHLPDHVGVVAIRSNGAVTTLRPAASNIHRLVADHLFSMLRTSEVLELLGNATGYVLDVPQGNAWARLKELFAELPIEIAHDGVVAILRRRGTEAAKLAGNSAFPFSLRALAYATELSNVGQQRLLDRLGKPASLVMEG